MVDPTSLYSYKGEYPKPLPNRLRLSDGSTVTDVTTFTDDQIIEAGYIGPIEIPQPIKDYDIDIEEVRWNNETVQFDFIQYTDEFLFNRMRTIRNSYLNWTDKQVLPDAPFTDAERELIYEYRQSLRDLPSTVSDIKNVVWPEHPLGNDYDPRWLVMNNKIVI
jgi:hypothetical protein